MSQKCHKIIELSLLFAAVCVFIGCGGGGSTANVPVPSQGASINGRWVNRTSLPDSEAGPLFEKELIEAKAELYNPQKLLNGQLARPFTTSEMACMQNAEPKNWHIVGLNSVPASEINALPTCQHCPYTDPTPFIYCPENSSGYRYCNAYLSDGKINVPDSHPHFIGPWELDNKLMEVCGVEIGPR